MCIIGLSDPDPIEFILISHMKLDGFWVEWDPSSHPKRPREEDDLAGYPRGAKALKTLDDEGVLYGCAVNCAAKDNKTRYEINEETAKYMLHSNIEDRRRWCEKLVTGKTSICNVVKVIEAYRQAQATLTHQNTMDARRGDRVLVIDGNGVIH